MEDSQIVCLTTDDVEEEARKILGRDLTDEELMAAAKMIENGIAPSMDSIINIAIKEAVEGSEPVGSIYSFSGVPTIGYCLDCKVLAVYDNVNGLYCPKCETKDISIFEHDGKSRCPE